jgi:hypothetical protein
MSNYRIEVSNITDKITTFAESIKSQIKGSLTTNSDYGVPFFTGQIVNGREIWGAIFDFGMLPNKTWKSLLISADIISEWGGPGDHWLDTSHCYGSDSSRNETIALPHVEGGRSSVQIELDSDSVWIRTKNNKSKYRGIVAIKYYKAGT